MYSYFLIKTSLRVNIKIKTLKQNKIFKCIRKIAEA